MQENKLYSVIRKAKYRKAVENPTIKENILNRDFKAEQEGKKYVTDITCVLTRVTYPTYV